MRRVVVWGLLALAAWGCVPGGGGVPGPVPNIRPGAARLTLPSVRLVRYEAPAAEATAPRVATDSLEVTATWSLPALADAPTYGGLDTLRVEILGGYPAASFVLFLPPSATTITRNLPLNLSGAGSPGAAGVGGRVCVTTRRRGVDGPQVCRDTPLISVTFPAPAGVTGLTATIQRRSWP